MSFDNKNYPHRKDHRKPYYRSGKCDRTCRPNGGCPYCQSSRLHAQNKAKISAKEQING